ncbi:restriction endonuclease subunit S [Baaleninema simplex]|uniref:restriction endonuclease subunit S n=1 Tax=Baaleninema simplex TaxID=2862350 RepID=UPI00036A0E6E|nr:restriction endonuclease subunit S [Baaleninema simplex]
MDKTWKTKPFGELTSERLIGLVRGSKEQSINFQYSYIKMDSIYRNGRLDLSLATRVNATSDEVDRYKLKYGDFLFNTRNSHELVGKSAIFEELDGIYLFNNNIMRVRFHEFVHPQYINFAFQSNIVKSQLEKLKNKTTSVCAIYDSKLISVKIPLPSIEEQKRIAEILDKADAVRRKRQEAIRLTEELLRSTFLEMFGDPVTNPKGWPTVSFKKLMMDSPQNGIYKPAKDYGSGVPIVRIDSFDKTSIKDIRNLKRVSLNLELTQKYQLKARDILVNRVNSISHLGKSAVVLNLNEPTVYESNMMRISVDEQLANPIFLVFQLQDPWIKGQIKKKSRDAVNQSSINQQDVSSFMLRLPPIDLQIKFETAYHKIYKFKSRLISEKSFHENLFNSLLQRAFRGEL